MAPAPAVADEHSEPTATTFGDSTGADVFIAAATLAETTLAPLTFGAAPTAALRARVVGFEPQKACSCVSEIELHVMIALPAQQPRPA